MPYQTPQNPYDESVELNELDAINAELEQARASIESNFAEKMANETSDELEELFFNDKIAFYKAILQKQNEFLEQNINPKIQRAQELQGVITQKKGMQSIEAAQAAFMQNHPDVDMKVLMDFFINVVPQGIKEKLEELDPHTFFEVLLRLFEEYQNKDNKEVKEEQLPQKVSGVPSDTTSKEKANSDLPTQRL